MLYGLMAAYNEEKTIREVAKQTLKYVDKLIIIDDGSTDKTLEQTRGLKNTVVLSHSPNHGKGYALIKGYKYFLKTKGKWLVTIDADKQHDPTQIPFVSILVRQNAADIVIGSRYASKKVQKYPLLRVFFNIGVNMTMILITGSFFADVASGFRCYSRNALKKIVPGLNIKDVSDYGIEPETLVLANKHNLKIATVPVTCHYFTKEKDNFNILAKSYLKFAWRHKWNAIKRLFRQS